MFHVSSRNWRRAAVASITVTLAIGLAACSPTSSQPPASSQPPTSSQPTSSQPPTSSKPAAPTSTSEAPVTLTMTIWGGDVDQQTMQKRLDLAKAQYPNITVNLQLIASDYETKVQTMIAGNTAPDIMETAESVNAYSSKGQLVDLTSYFKDAGIDPVASFGKGSVDTYSTGGKLWGAPDRSGPAVVYYNKDLFDKAGVAYPTADWDWQAMRDAAKKLTQHDASGNTTVWGYAAGDWWPWYMSWMYQNGGQVLDASDKPVVNTQANIDALTFYNDMVFKDKSCPSPTDYANEGLKNGSPDPLFAQGKLAMEVTGFWNISSLKDSSIKWGIAPMWHGTQKAVPAFSNALAVTAQSKNQAAAAKIVLFLTSAAGQKPIAESGLDVPSNLQAVADPSFQKATWNTGGIDLSAFTSSAADVFAPPYVPQWNEIQKAFSDGLADTWMGTQSVADGLNLVQQNLQTLLG